MNWPTVEFDPIEPGYAKVYVRNGGTRHYLGSITNGRGRRWFADWRTVPVRIARVRPRVEYPSRLEAAVGLYEETVTDARAQYEEARARLARLGIDEPCPTTT